MLRYSHCPGGAFVRHRAGGRQRPWIFLGDSPASWLLVKLRPTAAGLYEGGASGLVTGAAGVLLPQAECVPVVAISEAGSAVPAATVEVEAADGWTCAAGLTFPNTDAILSLNSL